MKFKNTRLQGDAGVAATLAYCSARGWPVSIPFGEGQRYDLIVDDGELRRVQCKTTLRKNRYGNYEAMLKTCGGNRSGKDKITRISADEVDWVFIFDGDGHLWHFTAAELAGMSTRTVGKRCADKRVL